MSSKLRIVLVDEDHDVRQAVRRLLDDQLADSEVQEVSGADEWSRALTTGPYDRAISSSELSWLEPRELGTQVAGRSRFTPVILFSARDERHFEAIELGAGTRGTASGQLERVVGEALARMRARAPQAAAGHPADALLDRLGIAMFTTTVDGELVAANTAMLHLLGASSIEELLSRSIADFYVRPQDRTALLESIGRRGQLREHEVELLRCDGRRIWVSISEVLSVTADGRHLIEGIMADVSERVAAEGQLRQAEEALREREGLLQAIFDAEPECVALLGRDGTVREINAAGLRIVELQSSAAVTGRSFLAFVTPEHRESVQALIEGAFEGVTGMAELEIVGRRGSRRWLEMHSVPLRADEGEVTAMLCIARDITEKRRAEAQLVHDALHDALTGLPNRTLFMERLGHAVDVGRRRPDYRFAVLFLDIDRFKVVVESLGHTAGDELLVAIARRLEAALRPGDTVARLGGDEFALLLEDLRDVNDATHVADRMQKELTVPFYVDGQEVFATASIGIAYSRTGYERAEDVLRDADTAMYRAKAQGKARYQLFDQGMHAQAVTRLRLETDLRRAVERRELALRYQPIFDVATGKLAGFEALLRWQHPETGLVMPSDFIPIAEETGLINQLGQWALAEACRQVRQWNALYVEREPMMVSVNISARQFRQPDLVEQIEQTLRATRFAPQLLRLELTESAVMEQPHRAVEILGALRARKVRLYMDDFGTGYCSFSYLHRFALDGLKIDRSFIEGVGRDDSNAEIVGTIVSLARALGIDTVAEGVENQAQLALVRELGCTHVQGNLLSSALTTEEAERLLADPPALGTTP